MEIRSFLAFELPPDLRGIISRVAADAGRFPLDVRWVNPANIHLTALFIGNVPEGRIKPMGRIAAGVCRGHRPFSVSPRGMGLFGSRRHPRVLWIGLEADIDRMSQFRDDLQESLSRFGIKRENRPFNAHLTLGRFRRGRGPSRHMDELLSSGEDLTGPAFILKELVLYKSDLRRGGAVYTRLDAWPLGEDPTTGGRKTSPTESEIR